MENNILKSLLKEYEKKKYYKELEYEEQKQAFLDSNEDLKNINNILNKCALNISKAILIGDKASTDLLKKTFEKNKKIKDEIINNMNFPEYLKSPNYDCKICKDSGYINDKNYKSILCNCIKQKLYDIQYNKSNISSLNTENFDNFNYDLYSNEINPEKYKSNISPRENMHQIVSFAKRFIDKFDDSNEKNLLFTGNTGLGKTFLSNCIAKELLDNHKTVLYQTAPIMLDSIIDFRFGKSNSQNFYNEILNANLLIIDDLGTESLNSLKFTELFNIINTRLLNQNNQITKTIISTNLSLEALFNTYDERIVSRLVGNYNICRFFGDDIRFIKNKN